jgi:hypothetical protein
MVTCSCHPQLCGEAQIRGSWFRPNWAQSEILSQKQQKGWGCGSSGRVLPSKHGAQVQHTVPLKKKKKLDLIPVELRVFQSINMLLHGLFVEDALETIEIRN